MRYADDLIIMVGSKKAAERVMKSVSRYIEEKLGLKVNAEKSKVDKSPKELSISDLDFTMTGMPKDTKPDRTRKQ